MSLTHSHMLPLGTKAPDFSLPDTISGKHFNLKDLKLNQATVIMFICNHCPYVKHLIDGVVSFAKDYQQKGVNIIAISSNDVDHYPDDSPEKMQQFAKQHGFTFPYLYDESQAVARAYDAACTPDFYIFDNTLTCVYRGRFDGSSPGNDVPVSGHDMRAALDDLLQEKPVTKDQFPSMGCNVKWK